MSSSSLAPSRHRKTPPKPRTCDYGDEHVKRDKYEGVKEDVKELQRKLEDKNDELLKYHNELAEAENKAQASQELVRTLQGQVRDQKKEIDAGIDDYNRAVENQEIFEKERDEAEALHKKAIERAQKLEEELRELRPLKRGRSPAPAAEEVKRLKTESQDLRKRVTQLESAEEQRLRLANELAEARERLRRFEAIDAAFTPKESEDCTTCQEWQEAAREVLGDPKEEPGPDWNPYAFQQFAKKLIQEDKEAEEELKGQVADLERRNLLLERSEKASDAANLQLKKEARRCREELKDLEDLRTELEDWKGIQQRYEAESFEAFRGWIESLVEFKQNNSLEAFRALLPKDFRYAGSGPSAVAEGIRDYYTWTFNEVWNLLPVDDEEELVTPSVQTPELGNRLATRARKLTRELLRIPALEKELTLRIQEITDLKTENQEERLQLEERVRTLKEQNEKLRQAAKQLRSQKATPEGTKELQELIEILCKALNLSKWKGPQE